MIDWKWFKDESPKNGRLVLLSTNVPEKHRATAHAWVDGADVQRYSTKPYTAMWIDDHAPGWFEDEEYRIKPKPLKLEVGNFYRNKDGERRLIRTIAFANQVPICIDNLGCIYESDGTCIYPATRNDLIAEVEG